jgi:hypothetical protein
MTRSLKPGETVAALALAALAFWWFFGGGAIEASAPQVQDIEDKVATDAVTQYGIAKRNGSATDACIAAMGVSAAYLQAKDETDYAKWKQTEKVDCRAAGMVMDTTEASKP